MATARAAADTGHGTRGAGAHDDGLGDRHHLTHADITPDLHVEDIVQTIVAAEAQDVIPVGQSNGGFIITGVAARMPERVRALVYLDAFVPT